MNAKLRNILKTATELNALDDRRRTLLERLNALLDGRASHRRKPKKAKKAKMSATARRAISIRMKNYWAERRKK